jgi:hypothetical protein
VIVRDFRGQFISVLVDSLLEIALLSTRPKQMRSIANPLQKPALRCRAINPSACCVEPLAVPLNAEVVPPLPD